MITLTLPRFIVIAALAAATACSRDAKTTNAPAAVQTQGGQEMPKQQEGTSVENAIILEAKTQAEGVAAQQAWIEKHLPGARPAPPPKTGTDDEIVSFGQEVIQHGGKLYSVVHLVLPDGKARDVHFDITGYFGK
jgi:hypothetical protein